MIGTAWFEKKKRIWKLLNAFLYLVHFLHGYDWGNKVLISLMYTICGFFGFVSAELQLSDVIWFIFWLQNILWEISDTLGPSQDISNFESFMGKCVKLWLIWFVCLVDIELHACRRCFVSLKHIEICLDKCWTFPVTLIEEIDFEWILKHEIPQK